MIEKHEFYYCDHCGELVYETFNGRLGSGGGYKVYHHLPFDVASAFQGESGVVCDACDRELRADEEER